MSKTALDELLWGKKEGDGRTLAIWQSMVGGFLATCPGVSQAYERQGGGGGHD